MTELSVVGKSVPRVDGLEKVTGKAMYTADFSLPRMLHAKVLRSPYPHARILSIDASQATSLPGVRAVLTGKDVPDERMGRYIPDRHVLARDVVRFVGEGVVAVAAESPEIAEEALDLIRVDYHELPAIFDAEEAMRSDPSVVVHPDLEKYPLLIEPQAPNFHVESGFPNVYYHHRVRTGDVEKGFKEADLIMEQRFVLPRIHPCQTEPHAALARVEPDGGLTVWVTDPTPMRSRIEFCRLFNLPFSKMRVISPYLGGNMGGKWSAISGPVAMLLALRTGRPVRVVFSREEMFLDGRSDVPMAIYIRDGVKKDGTIVAREIKAILNGGAYATSAINVTRNMTFDATGTYRIPHFRWDSYCVATNEPPPGPFRGFGGNQVSWGMDCLMDMTAEKLGMDCVDYLRKNFLGEGEVDVLGQVVTNIGVGACLDKVVEWLGWGQESLQEDGPWRKGKGIALLSKVTAGGTTSVASVKVYDDATIEIRHSATECGQGCNTVLAQIAAEEFNTSMDKIKVVFSDSAFTPFDIGSIGNRDTFNTGNAIRLACQEAKRQLFEAASGRLGLPPGSLAISGGKIHGRGIRDRSINISELFMRGGWIPQGGEVTGWGVYTNPVSREDPETGRGEKLLPFYNYGACGVEVAVNVETGEVRVLRIGQCHDMGQPVNPKLCEGQIEGGWVMGLGRALFEEMVVERGACLNPNLSDYKLPSIVEVPLGDEVKAMIAPGIPHSDGPYGAKGFGDTSVLAIAPAIASAIYHATGVRLKELPMTREKVLAGLNLRDSD